MHLIAFICPGLVPGDFVHVIGDAHVYRTHVKPLEDQLQKLPKPFPVSTLILHLNKFLLADYIFIKILSLVRSVTAF